MTRILGDGWYAGALEERGVERVDDAIRARFPGWAQRERLPGVLRGVLWFLVSRGVSRTLCIFSSPGLLTFLALQVLSGRPRGQLFVIEFFRPEPVGWRARLKEAVHAGLCRWLLPRTLTAAQVSTAWEIEAYAEKYGVPPARFRHIAFPMLLDPGELPEPPAEPALPTVLSSGRAACDWPTVFSAAEDAGAWQLVVVCSAEERAAVDRLNRDGRARVLSEISVEEHERLLRTATLYALILREQRVSSGHVRLARAIEAGTPVVATTVQGLAGYVQDGVTAVTVPPGDPVALRQAIDRLVTDRAARLRLREQAYEAVRAQDLKAFVQQIGDLVLEVR